MVFFRGQRSHDDGSCCQLSLEISCGIHPVYDDDELIDLIDIKPGFENDLRAGATVTCPRSGAQGQIDFPGRLPGHERPLIRINVKPST
jgi:hypothetical protein